MPVAYISGKFEATVNFFNDKEFTYNEWINKKVAAERKERGHPSLTVWLEIPNTEEPIAPFTVPVNAEDFYDGSLSYTQSGLKFIITFDGKAKAKVHKLTLAKINEGGSLKLTGLSVNGAQIPVEGDEDGTGYQTVIINNTSDFIASSKKLN